MLMPASSEFIALCRSQVALLTQSLEASLSVVYLTEELTDSLDAKLTPIVSYPEAAAAWSAEQVKSLLMQQRRRNRGAFQLPGGDRISALPPASPPLTPTREQTVDSEEMYPDRQMVLPLVHEGVVMGLLLTTRSDRPWTAVEKTHLERIAATLSLACVLDQRSQWLNEDLHRQREIQARQRDIFDDLLHQFRNPLTALRTFGKLLIKRLHPGDPNRNVAESIVRESDRLRELLEHLDQAIDLREEDLLLPEGDERGISTKTKALAPAKTSPAALLPGNSYITGDRLHLTPHDWTDILTPLLATAEAIAQERQIELIVSLPAQTFPIYADDKALREVISNLLDNALKYTSEGGRVYVWTGDRRSTSSGTQQALGIADTGPGIPPEDQEHLFERHYRGIQSTTGIPGTGLGLAIARELVQQMQGAIEVISPVKANLLAHVAYQPVVGMAGTAVMIWLLEVAD